MYNNSNLNIQCDREIVLKSINCMDSNPLYSKVVDIYEEMLIRAVDLVDIKGNFKFIKGEQVNQYGFGQEYFVPCILTIGEKISKEISYLFKNNECLKAIILDAIGTQILFNASSGMFNFILKSAEENNLNLTLRFSPGNNDIPLKFESNILQAFEIEERLGISITEAYMLNPVKSMAYYYGAGKELKKSNIDHDCKGCDRMCCLYEKDRLISIKVVSENQETEICAKRGENLLKILRSNDIYMDSPCGGYGKCGKCKVKIIQGDFNYREDEKKSLSEYELNKGIRLACCLYPLENLEIEIVNDRNFNYNILAEYDESFSSLKPRVKILTLEGFNKSIIDGTSITEAINSSTGSNFKYSLRALRNLSQLYKEDNLCLITEKNYIIDIKSKAIEKSYGVAIDIGTTTIAMKLVNLIDGEVIGGISALNPQKQYGADVISRIQYNSNQRDGKLTNLLRECITSCIEKMCKSLSIDYGNIHNIGVVGNTTMLYFLLGINTEDLAQSPFNTIILDKQSYNYQEIFGGSLLNCRITLLPCISAYIGADIISDMLSQNFNSLKKITLMVDIGTNGEMAIGNREKIYCASTAAGPAFEGANIVDGVGSIEGAINRVYMKNNEIHYETINNSSPIGICGSGVIDIIALGLDNGFIEKTGRLNLSSGESYLTIASTKDKSIKFYQRDIREMQLAKSAIRSGIDILIDKFGCTYEDIESVLIAGGFGNNINVQSAARVGLIPKELNNRVKFIGNSALGGAVKYLLNSDSDEMLSYIKGKTSYFELAKVKEFSEKYISNMYF